MRYLFLVLISAFLPYSAFSQVFSEVSIDPNNPVINQPFKIVIKNNHDAGNCGLVVDFGDGHIKEVLATSFPAVIEHTYTKEGRVEVRIKSHTVARFIGHSRACNGNWKPIQATVLNSSNSLSYILEVARQQITVGTIASGKEICAVLQHPVFSDQHELEAKLWDKSKEVAIIVQQTIPQVADCIRYTPYDGVCRSWKVTKETQYFVIKSLRECREILEASDPNRLKTLEKTFQRLDHDWNAHMYLAMPQAWTPLPSNTMGKEYKEGYALILLTLREAHKTLNAFFDLGLQSVQANNIAIAKINAQIAESRKTERNIQDQREIKASEERKKKEFAYQQYKQNLSVVEEALNYASTGDVNGDESNYWRVQNCIATEKDGKKINLREINQTAFRITRRMIRNVVNFNGPLVPEWVSSDGNITFSYTFAPFFGGGTEPVMERLQKAWGLVFQQCAGKKSAF